MNETKHTPGPWNRSGTHYIVTTALAECGVICTMARNTEPVNYQEKPGSLEDAANARLIAAAPDLLDALKDLLQAAEKELDQSCTHEGLTNTGILVNARAAIGKAEGGEV